MSDATPEQPFPMRLQKFLARAGVASRRGSEDLMTAGRVSVNGQIVTELGSKVDPKVDVVCVDGREVHLEDGSVYLMLHKPKGYLTTMDDPQGRPCVAQLVPRGRYPGLFPVGRLDKDTTGLLLFTTDGDMGQRLLHPKHHVDKTYQAHVAGVPDEVDLARLRGGIMLDDAGRTVTVDGEPVALTPTEFDILRLLMQHAGTVFSPREIYRRVWGDSPVGVENAVAVHIRHLRSKIEIDPTEPRYLKVVWGKGYKMEERRNEKAAR